MPDRPAWGGRSRSGDLGRLDHAAPERRGRRNVTAIAASHLVTRSLDPTGTGRTRWARRTEPAINAFAITFGDRFPAAETY